MAGELSVWLAVSTVFIFSVDIGTAPPIALTQAISVNPQIIGSASGLYGFMQMVVGALCTSLAGTGHNPVLAAALVLNSAAIVSQAAFWIADRAPRQTA